MFKFVERKSREDEVVPDKLTDKIDYKIFVIICVAMIVFQVYLNTFKNPDDELLALLATLADIITPAIAAVFGFVVAKRYWNSEIFGKSYLALSLGMVMNALGEIIYYYYEQTGQTPSPSIADVAWLSFYPLTFYHLAKNIHFFKPTIKLPIKVLIVALPIAISGTYAFLEFSAEQSADMNFFLGLAYIIGSAIILSGSILGAIIFRQGLH